MSNERKTVADRVDTVNKVASPVMGGAAVLAGMNPALAAGLVVLDWTLLNPIEKRGVEKVTGKISEWKDNLLGRGSKKQFHLNDYRPASDSPKAVYYHPKGELPI